MITKDILPFIPQREPFVMIDKLLHVNDTITGTAFTITKENVFNENGFFAAAGLMENIAQTAAAAAGYKALKNNEHVPLGYIAVVKKFEVFFLPEVNNELVTETITTGNVLNMQLIAGKIMLNNKLVAQCEMRIFIEPHN